METVLSEDNGWRFDAGDLDEMLRRSRHNALLGQRYHDHGDRWVEMIMLWSDALAGYPGESAMARAPLLTLMDNCAGVAIWLRRGGFLPQMTVDVRADWLQPVASGSAVICRCECMSLSSSFAAARGFAYVQSPEEPVALVAATYALL